MSEEVEKFTSCLLEEFENLLIEDIILPSGNEEEYNFGDWTFLFNIAVVQATRQYNRVAESQFSVCAEPIPTRTPTGRGGYSDILVSNKDNKNPWLIIEHENWPSKENLTKELHKLDNSEADHRMIISYFNSMSQKEVILETIRNQSQRTIYVLLAPANVSSQKEFELHHMIRQ